MSSRRQGWLVDFLFCAKRETAVARRYFEKEIAGNAGPHTVKVDKHEADFAGPNAINADREVPIKIRQAKYLNK